MLETIKEIAIALALTLSCAAGAYILKTYKNSILAAILTLVNEAEEKITASGMGEEKKAKVIAQLEAMGIKVTAWVSAEIDNVVAQLNEKSGWFTASISDAASEITEKSAVSGEVNAL